jgi:hypothetical protein
MKEFKGVKSLIKKVLLGTSVKIENLFNAENDSEEDIEKIRKKEATFDEDIEIKIPSRKSENNPFARNVNYLTLRKFNTRNNFLIEKIEFEES